MAEPSAPAPAPVYNIRLLTDSTPDLTDLPSYLRSITAQYHTPQEQAIAIWRWSQQLRKQTSNPQVGGQDLFDPIALFNSFGHCNCGVVSGLNNAFWLNMGWKARYVQLGDHTVCETSWDGGKTWHMFDASMSFYCFNDAGQVASVTEIEKNPHFYLRNFAPECGTNPVRGVDDHQGWRQASDRPVHYQRSLANGWDSFKAPNSLDENALHAQWGQRYVLNLRPGEHYTRYFGGVEADSAARLFRPLKTGKDPESQHGHAIRGNGVWRYAPDLRAANAVDHVYDSRGLAWGDVRAGFAARAANGAEPGVLVFRVSAANVVTSAKVVLAASRLGEADSVSVDVSTTAGITWSPAWKMTQTGAARSAEVDLMPLVAGSTEFLVRVQLGGAGAGLESVAIDTITQLNRAALPRLVRGPNRVQLTLGRQVETIQFQPSIINGNHAATAHAHEHIDVEKETGFYKPVLRPAEVDVPAQVTWRIATPTRITGVDYGATACVKTSRDRTALLHSWDGKAFTKDFEKTDDTAPFDLMVNRALDSVPPDGREVFLRYEFQTQRNARSYSGPGIQMARMTVEHEPRIKGFTPIEVTYCWIEHHAAGDVERRHTELVKSPAHEYRIQAGGFRDPTMKWVRVNLAGSAPAGEKAAYGYSDGNAASPAEMPRRARYQWGDNLAAGKSYVLTGAQHEKNRDAGRDLTDGVIAPPDEDVSEKYMPTNVMFEKGATASAVIDLGDARPVAAVRVHAGQELGFKLAFPTEITVETSTDGRTFAEAGRVGHNQAFDPPAEFVPWENDASPKYAALPAGGRLTHAYRVVFDKPATARYVRITCKARENWGLLLSEMQVFDSVGVDTNVPPLVVLPPLSN